MSFPRADIHELLAPDLLHQIIKGTFKDHLVDWVEQYIKTSPETKKDSKRILADIDRRCAIVPFFVNAHVILIYSRIVAVPPFPGLRKFHEGRNFKQWTGNDSKGLMKVGFSTLSMFGTYQCIDLPPSYSWARPR